MQPHLRYVCLGILLGLGAPAGSLVLRIPFTSDSTVHAALRREWQTARFYYTYMTLSSVVVFGLVGLLLGYKNERLEQLSMTDGLTRICNHRHLQEVLSREIARSDRYRTPLTCLMLDIDDFKHVNDQYGHIFGDGVLQKTATLIRETIRRTDTVGRYGGEEFLVIMPATDTHGALPIAQRIVDTMHQTSITISAGLATYPMPEKGIKTKNGLLSAADQALYQAKRKGKDQVSIWNP